jgi:hypothetical protein
MRFLLAVIAVLFSFASALAWEPRASEVEARLRSARSFEPARAQTKPRWARRINRPEQKVHWADADGGKTYVFGVGLASGDIGSLALRIALAEDRARGSIVERVGEVQISTETLPDGRLIKIRTAVLNGSEIVDWYLDASGDLYALAVLAD